MIFPACDNRFVPRAAVSVGCSWCGGSRRRVEAWERGSVEALEGAERTPGSSSRTHSRIYASTLLPSPNLCGLCALCGKNPDPCSGISVHQRSSAVASSSGSWLVTRGPWLAKTTPYGVTTNGIPPSASLRPCVRTPILLCGLCASVVNAVAPKPLRDNRLQLFQKCNKLLSFCIDRTARYLYHIHSVVKRCLGTPWGES